MGTQRVWPAIDLVENGHVVVVDSFILVFFLDRDACLDPSPIVDAVTTFLGGPGQKRISYYVDEEGDAPPLPPDPTRLLSERIVRATMDGWVAGLTALETDGYGGRNEVKYYFDPTPSPRWPDKRPYLYFRLEHDRAFAEGKEQIGSFVRHLTDVLPYSYGYGSPALAYDEAIHAVHRVVHRHPGFDIADPSSCALDIGTRPLGAYWLSLFSKPMVEQLGGAEALQRQLPDAILQPAGQGGLQLRLGPAPDVGDVNRGNNLPAYRRLAKVLEPMLRVPEVLYVRDPEGVPSRDLQNAWHHRFQDPDPA